MKKIHFLLGVSLSLVSWVQKMYAGGFSRDISESDFYITVTDFFPWMSSKMEDASDKGVDNITELITGVIPMVTTMMAVGATLMVIWGGFHMVLGGVSSEQTEKGKSIMKDALIGLALGLISYMIITLLGSILDI